MGVFVYGCARGGCACWVCAAAGGRAGGSQIGDHKLDRVRVQRREGKGRGELVVLLVDAFVERPLVQRPVRVEEEELVHQQVREQHPRALRVRGQAALDTHAACEREERTSDARAR